MPNTWANPGPPVGTGTIVRKFKTADQSKVNNTLGNDADLILSLLPRHTYYIEGDLQWTIAAVTPGLKFGLAGTAGITNLLAQYDLFDIVGLAIVQTKRAAAFTTDVISYVPGANLTFTAQIRGTIEVSTGGTLALTWAQSVTSGGNNTTLLRGSYLGVQDITLGV